MPKTKGVGYSLTTILHVGGFLSLILLMPSLTVFVVREHLSSFNQGTQSEKHQSQETRDGSSC